MKPLTKLQLDQRLAAFVDACHHVGLKATPQRIQIYRELAQTTEHPNAQTIYMRVKKRISAISFDTVYRTLRTLEEHHLISQVGTPLDRSRFDANRERHHHFVCTKCGLIQDFYHAGFDQLAPPPDLETWGTTDHIAVEVRGVCKQCQRA